MKFHNSKIVTVYCPVKTHLKSTTLQKKKQTVKSVMKRQKLNPLHLLRNLCLLLQRLRPKLRLNRPVRLQTVCLWCEGMPKKVFPTFDNLYHVYTLRRLHECARNLISIMAFKGTWTDPCRGSKVPFWHFFRQGCDGYVL